AGSSVAAGAALAISVVVARIARHRERLITTVGRTLLRERARRLAAESALRREREMRVALEARLRETGTSSV
nr:hypothetical protein [Planctomycetota bacterium]